MMYKIRAGKSAPCELVALPETDDTEAICEGTYTKCRKYLKEIGGHLISDYTVAHEQEA